MSNVIAAGTRVIIPVEEIIGTVILSEGGRVLVCVGCPGKRIAGLELQTVGEPSSSLENQSVVFRTNGTLDLGQLLKCGVRTRV